MNNGRSLRTILSANLIPLLALLELLLGCPVSSVPIADLPADFVCQTSFVAVGDTGTGNADQLAVAYSMHTRLTVTGASFVVLLGDNFYPSGVTSTTDPQWQTKFENVYGNWGVPVYAVNGNHDYGGPTGAIDSRGQIEIDYTTAVTTKWTMPDKSWSWTAPDVIFLALDSNWIKMHTASDSESARMAGIAEGAMVSAEKWKIVFGHHPYFSNGAHGNAGNFDGKTTPDTLSGSVFRNFMDTHVMSAADLYLCGHDHGMQVLPSGPWKPLLCVSGGGSGGLTAIGFRNPRFFGSSQFGFAWVGISNKYLVVEMYSKSGTLLYRHILSK